MCHLSLLPPPTPARVLDSSSPPAEVEALPYGECDDFKECFYAAEVNCVGYTYLYYNCSHYCYSVCLSVWSACVVFTSGDVASPCLRPVLSSPLCSLRLLCVFSLSCLKVTTQSNKTKQTRFTCTRSYQGPSQRLWPTKPSNLRRSERLCPVVPGPPVPGSPALGPWVLRLPDPRSWRFPGSWFLAPAQQIPPAASTVPGSLGQSRVGK